MFLPSIILLASFLSFAVKDAMASPALNNFRDDDQNATVAECDACMAGMDLVYYIITDKYWVDTYIIMGKQLCETLPPGSFRNTCLTYVDVYFPHALKAMAIAIQPQFICKAIQACNSTESLVFKPRRLENDTTAISQLQNILLKIKSANEKFSLNSASKNIYTLLQQNTTVDNETLIGQCDACIAGISLFHFVLTDSYWRATYLIIGEQVCLSIPPGNLQNTCMFYVDHFLDQAITAMGNAIRPEFLCQAFRECNTTTNSSHAGYLDMDKSHNIKDYASTIQSWLVNSKYTDVLISIINFICEQINPEADKEGKSKSKRDNLSHLQLFALYMIPLLMKLMYLAIPVLQTVLHQIKCEICHNNNNVYHCKALKSCHSISYIFRHYIIFSIIMLLGMIQLLYIQHLTSIKPRSNSF
ncbi:unnamed protein product [Trichobilharzia szidati]|nr:unnamed protein product [Trichobilharzia szidati]CAH8840927.1 unnamed protein product [Trichobilharzia szidati]